MPSSSRLSTLVSGRVSNSGSVSDVRTRIAEDFRRFAREAAGRSPQYVEIAGAVAASRWTLDFLLCVDGRPTAWTDGHGTLLDWLGPSSRVS